MFGVNSPLSFNCPTNRRSSSWNVAVYSSTLHSGLTDAEVDIVRRVRLAVGPIAEGARLELLRALGKRRAAESRHAGLRLDLDAVNLGVDHERRGFRRAGDREIARTDARVRGDIDVDRQDVRRGAHDARHLHALSEIDIGRRGACRQVGAVDAHALTGGRRLQRADVGARARRDRSRRGAASRRCRFRRTRR